MSAAARDHLRPLLEGDETLQEAWRPDLPRYLLVETVGKAFALLWLSLLVGFLLIFLVVAPASLLGLPILEWMAAVPVLGAVDTGTLLLLVAFGSSVLGYRHAAWGLTEERLLVTGGLLRRTRSSVQLDEIREVDLVVEGLDRFLGNGRVEIVTAEEGKLGLELSADPHAAQASIRRAAREAGAPVDGDEAGS